MVYTFFFVEVSFKTIFTDYVDQIRVLPAFF